MLSVAFRERLDAHRLIEDFMILANVAAAETLEAKSLRLLYRVHEEPSPEKLEALREIVDSVGLTLAKGQVLKTAHLNRLLDGVAGTEHAEMVNISVLRSMTQAYYAPGELRPLRPQPAALRPLHLADPPLRRPRRPPRPDPRPPLGKRTASPPTRRRPSPTPASTSR